MLFARRTFLGLSVLAGIGSALPWPFLCCGAAAQTTGPVRLPLSQFSQYPAMVASLRKGVEAMKSLPGNDHRSWFWQGAIHSVSDAIYAAELERTPAIAQVDRARYWDQCPHFGEASADFLIWHRAYLYHFERVLRDIAQDASLAIPYWDYDDRSNRGFPAMFARARLGAEDTAPANSLYHANRELAFVTNRLQLSDAVGESSPARTVEHFFDDQGKSGLAGSHIVPIGTEPIQGLIERRPHNDVHLAVGGVIGDTLGAMADVPTAAFDPIFWVHHANVDRMWAEWATTAGKRWGELPPETWLNEAPWVFKDADGADRAATRRHYMQRAQLGIKYPSDDPSRPELQLPTSLIASTSVPADPQTRLVFSRAIALRAAPSQPAHVMVPANSVEASVGLVPGRLLLRLVNIRMKRTPAVGFAVFLIPRSRLAEGPKAQYQVGTLDLFGLGHRRAAGETSHRHAPNSNNGKVGSQTFDASALLEHFGREDLVVHVEPYQLLVPVSGAVDVRPDGVTIDRIEFRTTK